MPGESRDREESRYPENPKTDKSRDLKSQDLIVDSNSSNLKKAVDASRHNTLPGSLDANAVMGFWSSARASGFKRRDTGSNLEETHFDFFVLFIPCLAVIVFRRRDVRKIQRLGKSRYRENLKTDESRDVRSRDLKFDPSSSSLNKAVDARKHNTHSGTRAGRQSQCIAAPGESED